MPQASINFPNGAFNRLLAHLLPRGGVCEEAAFLLARFVACADGFEFSVVGELLIPPSGFASRSGFYLELTDEARARVIKTAHDRDAGLIECHSHPSQRGACFSWSDLHGFDEFVPHVRWRLGGRPYAAVVFAADSVDAIAWTDQSPSPTGIGELRADGRRISPTRLTLANWSTIYERSTV